MKLSTPYKLALFYFLLNAAYAAWQTLFNLHLDTKGFSSVQIGTLSAIFVATSAIVVPFWGMMADRHGTYRIFLLLTLVAGAMVLVIGWTELYILLILFIFVIAIFHQPGGAIMDGMAMEYIDNTPRKSFGIYRLWGSAGWAVSSLVVGYTVKENTQWIFYIASALFMGMTLINLLSLPAKPVQGRVSISLDSLSYFFKVRKIRRFLLMIFLYGVAVSPLHQFINLYYRDIGASNDFVGMVFFVQAAIEVPTFLVGVWLARRWSSGRILLLAVAVSMLRLISYSFLHIPEQAILLSAFHGITVAFFILGSVAYMAERTPERLRTTGQTMIWAFHFGAGVATGNLLLGVIRDTWDMNLAMLIHGLLALVTLILGLFLLERSARSSGAERSHHRK